MLKGQPSPGSGSPRAVGAGAFPRDSWQPQAVADFALFMEESWGVIPALLQPEEVIHRFGSAMTLLFILLSCSENPRVYVKLKVL